MHLLLYIHPHQAQPGAGNQFAMEFLSSSPAKRLKRAICLICRFAINDIFSNYQLTRSLRFDVYILKFSSYLFWPVLEDNARHHHRHL